LLIFAQRLVGFCLALLRRLRYFDELNYWCHCCAFISKQLTKLDLEMQRIEVGNNVFFATFRSFSYGTRLEAVGKIFRNVENKHFCILDFNSVFALHHS